MVDVNGFVCRLKEGEVNVSAILSSSYSEMQGLLEAVNHHAAAVGMRINASKTKVMSALIPGVQP